VRARFGSRGYFSCKNRQGGEKSWPASLVKYRIDNHFVSPKAGKLLKLKLEKFLNLKEDCQNADVGRERVMAEADTKLSGKSRKSMAEREGNQGRLDFVGSIR